MIELMMTMAILGVLALVLVPGAQVIAQREKEKELRQAIMQLRTAIDAYKRAYDDGRIQRSVGDSGYPKKLEDLVEGVPDVKMPNRQVIYFLRRLPRDPFATDLEAPAANTWGKRTYSSPPDHPEEGDDVFDVFSKSPVIGLNGIPVSQW